MEILTLLDAIKYILVPIIVGAAIGTGVIFILMFIIFLFADIISVPDWLKTLWEIVWIPVAIFMVIVSMWYIGVQVLYPGLVK